MTTSRPQDEKPATAAPEPGATGDRPVPKGLTRTERRERLDRGLNPQGNSARTLVTAAERAARRAHQGQRDRAGRPYVRHLARVARAVAQYGRATEAAAWLHDAIEDTLMTDTEITERFGEKIGYTVLLLTRNPHQKTYAEYISRLVERDNRDALIIKLEDICDHTLVTPEHLNTGLAKRYLNAYARLEAAAGRRWHSDHSRIVEEVLVQIAALPDDGASGMPNLSAPPTPIKRSAGTNPKADLIPPRTAASI